MLRRHLALSVCLAATVLSATEHPRAQTRSFDLLTAGIADIHAAVDAGALTYERLVGLYLKRIEAYERRLVSAPKPACRCAVPRATTRLLASAEEKIQF